MMVALNCGGGMVQPPGLTETSAIASDGRTASSCAATAPTAASLTAITQPNTTSFLRVSFTAGPLPSPVKARKEGTEAHAAAALPVHQLIERLADGFHRHDPTARPRLVESQAALGPAAPGQ